MGQSCAKCWENENQWVSYQKGTSNQNWPPTPKSGLVSPSGLPIALKRQVSRELSLVHPVVSSLPLVMLGRPWSMAEGEYILELHSGVRL